MHCYIKVWYLSNDMIIENKSIAFVIHNISVLFFKLDKEIRHKRTLKIRIGGSEFFSTFHSDIFK